MTKKLMIMVVFVLTTMGIKAQEVVNVFDWNLSSSKTSLSKVCSYGDTVQYATVNYEDAENYKIIVGYLAKDDNDDYDFGWANEAVANTGGYAEVIGLHRIDENVALIFGTETKLFLKWLTPAGELVNEESLPANFQHASSLAHNGSVYVSFVDTSDYSTKVFRFEPGETHSDETQLAYPNKISSLTSVNGDIVACGNSGQKKVFFSKFTDNLVNFENTIDEATDILSSPQFLADEIGTEFFIYTRIFNGTTFAIVNADSWTTGYRIHHYGANTLSTVLWNDNIVLSSRDTVIMVDKETGTANWKTLQIVNGLTTYVAKVVIWKNRLFHLANNADIDRSTYSISELNNDGSIKEVHSIATDITDHQDYLDFAIGDDLAICGVRGVVGAKSGWIKIFSTEDYTGVSENMNTVKSGISIYPNPAADFISINGLKTGEEVKIYNLTGKLMNMAIYNGQIDVQCLTTGLYFARTSSGSAKFIVK